jgi:hypothetical protein
MATYTQDDLANINAIISGGLKQAMINGEMVAYRDLGELLKIKRAITADLAGAPAAPARFPVRYPATDRGV